MPQSGWKIIITSSGFLVISSSSCMVENVILHFIVSIVEAVAFASKGPSQWEDVASSIFILHQLIWLQLFVLLSEPLTHNVQKKNKENKTEHCQHLPYSLRCPFYFSVPNQTIK